MAFQVKKAKREKIYTKIALMAPSGGGKTYGALRLATGMAEEIKKDIGSLSSATRKIYDLKTKIKNLGNINMYCGSLRGRLRKQHFTNFPTDHFPKQEGMK